MAMKIRVREAKKSGAPSFGGMARFFIEYDAMDHDEVVHFKGRDPESAFEDFLRAMDLKHEDVDWAKWSSRLQQLKDPTDPYWLLSLAEALLREEEIAWDGPNQIGDDGYEVDH